MTRPWQHIIMDFVTTPVSGEYDQILVIVDRFSKFTILIPTKKDATTYQLLWIHVFSIFGTPETATSDRDKIFRTEKWKKMMSEIKICKS